MDRTIVDAFRREFYELLGSLSVGELAHNKDLHESAPDTVNFCTEQELRRLIPEELPAWVPLPDFHRPDGYWGIEIDGKTLPVAVEVELNRKAPSAYAAVGEYYADSDRILRVFWLVQSQAVALGIEKKLARSQTATASRHNFVTLPDFMAAQWGAQIVRGPDQGQTIRSALFAFAGKTGGKHAESFPSTKFIDTRKSHGKSTYYTRNDLSQKRN